MVLSQEKIAMWQQEKPILQDIINLQPVFWQNPKTKGSHSIPLSIEDMEEAEQLWQRFAPFLAKAFPESSETKGIIESPLREINNFKKSFNEFVGNHFFLKCDNDLPIAGSIKARGGVYEVLHYAETLALEAGLVSKTDDYSIFTTDRFTDFFQQYSIGVGSTGNLGLSIGIISAKLGFNVSVYMSSDAKQWKKDLLRDKGVNVREFSGDFSHAVNIGRKETLADPKGYFVDDEDSKYLFLGYSVAAFRLKKQLLDKNIRVDKEHPLFVYLPCGVGGAPGGIAFGLKQIFGEHVHCFFVEPTHSPAVLIGLVTEMLDKVCVQDFGIDNKTEADGLAVGRPSRFATVISGQLISGIYTIEDHTLYTILTTLADTEGIYLEPSATAGLIGPKRVLETNYLEKNKINPENITHIAWATGGSLVPEADMDDFYKKGKSIERSFNE